MNSEKSQKKSESLQEQIDSMRNRINHLNSELATSMPE